MRQQFAGACRPATRRRFKSARSWLDNFLASRRETDREAAAPKRLSAAGEAPEMACRRPIDGVAESSRSDAANIRAAKTWKHVHHATVTSS